MFTKQKEIQNRGTPILAEFPKATLINIINELEKIIPPESFKEILLRNVGSENSNTTRRGSMSVTPEVTVKPVISNRTLAYQKVDGSLNNPFVLMDFTDNRWVVPESSLNLLSIFPVDGKGLRVIAVVGAMRQGKSYILNRLANSQGGFAVGGNVNSCTHGIWAWLLPRENEFDGIDTLLIDTEGMFDPKRRRSQFDQQIVK
eukprot:gene24596-32031_t